MLSRIYQDGLELRTDLKKYKQRQDVSDEEKQTFEANVTARLDSLSEQWKILLSPMEDKLQNVQNQVNAMADRLEQSEKNQERMEQEIQAGHNNQLSLTHASQQTRMQQSHAKGL